jgi:hypothetical protein
MDTKPEEPDSWGAWKEQYSVDLNLNNDVVFVIV